MSDNASFSTGAAARQLAYRTGRVLLTVGVVMCAVSILAGPVEHGLRPYAFFYVTGATLNAGGGLVGYGAILIAIGRIDDIQNWISGIAAEMPGTKESESVEVAD